MKFLIIRFSSIGDIVLTSPVVRCLKKQVPDAVIHYLTKKNYADVISNNPHIDKIHYFTNSLSDVIDELQQEQFDQIIDLHHNFRNEESAPAKFLHILSIN